MFTVEYAPKQVVDRPLVSRHVCVQSLGIPVKTHTFLNQHMWWVFIAPALMSPWKPMMGAVPEKK